MRLVLALALLLAMAPAASAAPDLPHALCGSAGLARCVLPASECTGFVCDLLSAGCLMLGSPAWCAFE
jgi:hypothetical protein